jgi:PAS domain S-box-containing protein
LFNMVVVTCAAILILGVLWIHNEYSTFESDAQAMRQRYMEFQKTRLQDEVMRVIFYVNFLKAQTQSRLKFEIRSRVYEAHAIATNIYEQNRDKKSIDEIKQMVKSALRPIRFNEGRGYYFTVNIDGTSELFTDRPWLEGKSILDLQGGNGEFVVRDLIEIAQNFDEGYYYYTFTKPNQPGSNHEKIAYIKYFKPFNWFIGTGEYSEDVRKEIQDDVIAWIETISLGKENYFIAGDWNGVALVGPLKGINTIGFTDPNGKEFIREMIEAAKNGGGFLTYIVPSIDGRRSALKLSYVMAIPDWRWMVGTGVLLDEIENIIEQRRQDMVWAIWRNILQIGGILVLLIGITVFLAWRTNRKAKASFNLYSSFLGRAAHDNITINPSEMHYRELEDLAKSANLMIEARKAAEDSLLESEERYRTVVDQAADAIFLSNLEGRFIDVNQKACEVLGYTREELLNLTVMDIDNKFPGPKELQGLWDQVSPDKPLSMESYQRRKDGSLFPVELSIGQFEFKGQTLYLGLARDITQRKEAEEEKAKLETQLLQSQKMEAIGTLAGGIAHDFNNILAAITGFTELALEDHSQGLVRENRLRRILDSAERAKELVAQILTFSRRSEVVLTDLDLNREVTLAVKLLERTIPKMIGIDLQLAENLWPIRGNQGQLEQVLVNLGTNAKDAMPNGGRLVIKTENIVLDEQYCRQHAEVIPGSYVLMTVSDTGLGMDTETARQIFDPFFTTKEVGKGTGLGLSMVYGVVKSHGGYISCYSEPGVGTTFRIYLPVSGADSVTESVKRLMTETITGGDETILLVDDEEALRDIGREMLSNLGYRVITADSGETAIQNYRNNDGPIDMVILDVNMPGMGGFQCLRELNQLNPDLPVIIASGYSVDEHQRSMITSGAAGFVAKPFRRLDLLKKVRDVLDGKKKT